MNTLKLAYDGDQHATALKEPHHNSVAIDCPYTAKGDEFSPGNLLGISVAGCMLSTPMLGGSSSEKRISSTASQPSPASLSSMYARLRGSSHPETGLPTNVLLTHSEIDGQYSKELGRVLAGSAPGKLGAAYAPFRYNEGGSQTSKKSRKKTSSKKGSGSIAEDMKLNIASNRLDDRRGLLRSLDRMKSDVDAASNMDAMDEYQMQASVLAHHCFGRAPYPLTQLQYAKEKMKKQTFQ